MKTYNALSKSFTDKMKSIMGGGKSIDEAFYEVKMYIFGSDFDNPTPTPKPIDVNELTRGDGEENGYRYVDLGLPSGLKWATCNVGASTATYEGLLFQFGRVDGYKYKYTNHQFRTTTQNVEDTGNRYIPKTATGATYDKGATLGSDDDAAHVNMGGNWRMPKESDYNELLNNTEKNVVTLNGVKGMLFTSKINGHQLFIPFIQGFWNGIGFHAFESLAYMWSSQVHSSNIDNAYLLYCNSYGGANVNVNDSSRTNAFSVRGVFQV